MLTTHTPLVTNFEQFAKLGGVVIASFALGAALVSCDSTDPVVVTDTNNVVIDMPPGVSWDLQYPFGTPIETFVDECNHVGGDPDIATMICHGIDY